MDLLQCTILYYRAW